EWGRPRAHCHDRGAAAPGQAQTDLYALRGRRRSRGRRERGEGEADGTEGRSEDLSPSQRLRRRIARGARPSGAAAEARAPRRGSGARDAAEDEARRSDVSEVESVRRSGSSARGAETLKARGRVTWQQSSITEPVGARHRPRASSFGPVAGSSASTIEP